MKGKAAEYLNFRRTLYSESTFKSTRTFLRKYHEFLEETGMEEGLSSLAAWMSYLEREGFSPGTIRNAVGTVVAYFRFAGVPLDQNILEAIKRRVPVSERKVDVMTEDEVRDLMLLTTNMRHKLLFALMYTYARRLGEVISLTWDDIDFEAGTITFNILKKKGVHRATFPLDETLAKMLRVLRRKSGGRRVFNMSERAAEIAFRSALRKAGIKPNGRRLTPHTLRSSRITHLLKNGTPIDVVSKHVARHSNFNTTLQFYRAITGEEALRIPLYEDFMRGV